MHSNKKVSQYEQELGAETKHEMNRLKELHDRLSVTLFANLSSEHWKTTFYH